MDYYGIKMKLNLFRSIMFSLVLLLFSGLGNLFPLQKEAQNSPRQIFALNFGGIDTDVFWQGYWRYKFHWGTGLKEGPEGFVFPVPYPGMADGFEFAQEPDFFLSVLFLKHYFLEFSFADKSDHNTFAMGYMGDENTTVKEVRIGNSGIGMGEYWGIESSSPQYNTPGIKAVFGTNRSEHEVLIRYDPAEQESRTFIGGYEVVEERLKLPNYRTGQNFILPDTDIYALEVYIESATGELTGSDGRRYTKRNIDYNADLSRGFLNLEKPVSGRVLVFYQCQGKDIGDDSLGRAFIMASDGAGRPNPLEKPLKDFSWSEPNPYAPKDSTNFWSFEESAAVQIDGHKALLIHNPGEFSSFQMYNTYDFHQNLPVETWRTLIDLTEGGLPVNENNSFLFLTEKDDQNQPFLRVKVKGTEDRSPWNRVPFAGENPGIYGPGKDTKTAGEILIGIKQNNSGYFLGNNLVKGSVRVFVNGEEDQSVTVNYSTGRLEFSRYIFPKDRIEVRYRTENAGLGGGDLLMAQGNRLFLKENLRLELGESLRWSLPKHKMSTEAGENPGQIDLAGALFYERENLRAMAGGSINISTADTSGNLRLFGMEEGGFSFSISQAQLLPADNPLTPLPDSPFTLNPNTQKPLIHTNFFHKNDFGQSTLNSWQWSGASVDPGKEGPSLARSRKEDPFESRVMVMDCKLDAGEWSAGDFLPDAHGLIDLSGYEGLSFWLRGEELDMALLKLYLIIGENGESQDVQEDGILEKGDERFIVAKNITPELPSSSGKWEKISLSLTAAERKRLSRVRSFRFILQSDGGPQEGRLMAAGFKMTGSPLQITVKDSSGSIKSRENVRAREVYDSSLPHRFPHELKIFHPEGEDQKALKISWGTKSGGSDLSKGDRVQASGWFHEVAVSDYGEFALYIKNSDTEGTGRFDLTDSRGRGIHIQYKPGSKNWEKLTVNLRDGRARFSGTSPSSKVTALSIDRETAVLSRLKMERIVDPGPLSGTLFLDEIHFSQPNYTTASALESSVDYKKPGLIKSFSGGFPILANLETSGRLKYGHKESQSVFQQESQRLESGFSAGADLMALRIEGDFDMVWTGRGQSLRGGHFIRIPASFPKLWISDSYSRSFHEGRDVMTRENVLHGAPLSSLNLEISSAAQGDEHNLLQSWEGMADFKPLWPFSGRGDVRLFQKTEWFSNSENYFGDWARDFRYLKAQEGNIQSREGLFSTTFEGHKGFFGGILKNNLGYTARQELAWEQENRWTSDISFPMEFPGRALSWTLTPGYKRSLKQKHSPRHHEDFSHDMDTLFKGIYSQLPLSHFIPVYDVFAPQGLAHFEKSIKDGEDSCYSPELYCRLNRPSGSQIKDLFLPAGMDISAAKSYNKKKDSLYTREAWTLRYNQRAINLFGTMGSHPFLNFYESDEIASSLQLVLGGRNQEIPALRSIVYQNYFFLTGGEAWQLILDNSFTQNREREYNKDDFQLILRWAQKEMPFIRLPISKRQINKSARMHHEERLTFSGYFNTNKENKDTFDTVLRHESSLIIQNFGSLKGWMTLGLGEKQGCFRGGYELGAELEITF